MSFFGKIRMWFERFMQGRYGADALGNVLLWSGVVLSIIELFTGFIVMGILGMAAYGYGLFRMLSRNTQKRRQENIAFCDARARIARTGKQLFSRAKHSGEYKYFKCPKCKAPLRLPRKVGQVTVTCKKCANRFDMKA